MRIPVVLILCFSVAALFTLRLRACDGEPKGEELKISDQWREANSGVKEAKTEVIKSESEWESAWKKTHSRIFPQPDVPKVDFHKQMVLAVHAGQKKTGGYSVEFSKVEKAGEEVKAYFIVQTPGPDEVKAQVLTAPSCFAVVPKVEMKVTFVREKK